MQLGVDFTNILCTAFTLADPKSAKNTVKPQSFLRFWDLCVVIAASKMLVKLTPGLSELGIFGLGF